MLGVFRRRGMLEIAALTGALLSSAAISATPAKAETFNVHVDQARLMRVPSTTSTLVIGNPLIADVTVQAGGVLVVTGKGYGTTNLMALDRGGNVVSERTIVVSGPDEKTVVVWRSMERQTLNCSPLCEPRITLGDAPNVFNPTLEQTGARNGQARGAAGGPAGVGAAGAAAAAPAPR